MRLQPLQLRHVLDSSCGRRTAGHSMLRESSCVRVVLTLERRQEGVHKRDMMDWLPQCAKKLGPALLP